MVFGFILMKKTIQFVLILILALPVFSQNNPPTAVNDYAVTTRGHVIVDVLANDYDVDGDSIYLFRVYTPHHGTIRKLPDQKIEYSAFPS